MENQFVIKCSLCKKLLQLNQFNTKIKIINAERINVKKKTCYECSITASESMRNHHQRHGLSAYYYRKENDML